MSEAQPTLTVVGSGISGLVTAWHAIRSGLQVKLFSKSPDPRLADDSQAHESSTFDSKNDQRYITLFEGHPYLHSDGYVDKMYPGIARDFITEATQGGVLVAPFSEFSPTSARWLERRAKTNERLGAGDQTAVTALQNLFASYANENRAAMVAWYEMLIELVEKHPPLATTLSINADGILRLYDDAAVFEQATLSHLEGGVFKRAYSPEALVEDFPAYAEGVRRGFIQGGAIEMFGLALGIKKICLQLIAELEAGGANLSFSTEVERIEKDDQGIVRGLRIDGKADRHVSDHYVFHTGAFAGPELFQKIAGARDELAAVEGYWITIRHASSLIAAMGGKPNKVHGKKTLFELLEMVEPDLAMEFRRRFLEVGISEMELRSVAPTVDFNNMPLVIAGEELLGVGSGYVYKGLAERDAAGRVSFLENDRSDRFVLLVMELWLHVLHGSHYLSMRDNMVVHPIGCKRSWTPDDCELDVNLRTAGGGLCMIHDGGNTGSTTKSHFIAKYALAKIERASEEPSLDFRSLRAALGLSRDEVGPREWAALTRRLRSAIVRGRSNAGSRCEMACVHGSV